MAGNCCRVVGNCNHLTGHYNLVEGDSNHLFGSYSRASGNYNTLSGHDSYAAGENNTLTGPDSRAVGADNRVDSAPGNNGNGSVNWNPIENPNIAIHAAMILTFHQMHMQNEALIRILNATLTRFSIPSNSPSANATFQQDTDRPDLAATSRTNLPSAAATVRTTTVRVKVPRVDEERYDKLAAPGEPVCIICRENLPLCAATPCMHVSYCIGCARALCLRQRDTSVQCAKCRQGIVSMVRVYLEY